MRICCTRCPNNAGGGCRCDGFRGGLWGELGEGDEVGAGDQQDGRG